MENFPGSQIYWSLGSNNPFYSSFQISGSASYLNDEISTDEFVRMTYKFSKKGKQVTVKSDSANTIKIDEVCAEIGSDGKLPATHVITEVKYGFNAFLLFQTKKTKKTTKQDIGGKLSIVIKKIPGIGISGSGSVKWTESEKEITNNLTFKFHGDTVIDPPPQTFVEAVQVYKSLPKLSKENERVVSFSIAPLTEYCGEADRILNDIAEQNINDVSEMMEDFEKVRKYLRKLKNSNLAVDFQKYRAVLLDAEQRYEEERSKFTSKLQKLLPQMRSDASKKDQLTALLNTYKSSRYERETFTGFLDTRQKEIETAEYIIYNPDLPASTYIDLDSTGDMAECIIGHEYALVYELEILPGEAKKLGDDYKYHCADTSTSTTCTDYDESQKWFTKEDEVGLNRPLMADFKKLAIKNKEIGASICFLVKLSNIPDSVDGSANTALTAGEKQSRFHLNLLKAGETLMEGFEGPSKIQTEQKKVTTKSRQFNEVVMSVEYSLKKIDNLGYQLRTTYNQIDESVSWID